ncbi:Sugar transporter ERD6-like 8 [Vitis vinifera]|uniref:Sugar transporter ERD6-like 8 n=2 Tax=Vitis vinifera TaxID=29760 RepID=A0A438KC30_VITVI|nr:Sugar transporter ERD6-like 8 [Vitis vinifera]
MATRQDVEKGNDTITKPLIGQKKEVQIQSNNGGLWVVLLSTLVAVCGSFEFGSCTVFCARKMHIPEIILEACQCYGACSTMKHSILVGYSAPAEYGIMDDLGISYSEYSFFGSILTIGAMIGAITSGQIADFIGRKGAMGMSSMICIAGWFTVYLSFGSFSLYSGRFLLGYGIGVLSYVVPVFIAEITPKNLRGALATAKSGRSFYFILFGHLAFVFITIVKPFTGNLLASQLFIVTGLFIAYVIGAIVTWRILALTGIVPCMVLLVGLFFIPESPRWLAKVGNEKEFKLSLQKLRGADADISEEVAEIQEYIVTHELLPKVTIMDLLGKQNIRSVVVGVGLMVFQQFGGINGIVFYAGQIFVSAGVPPNVGGILYACLQVSAYGMLLGCLLTGTSFLLKAHQLATNLVPILAVTGILVYIGFYSVGLGAIPWVIMSEIFPLHIKGTAGSLVTLVNWCGSWAVSYTFNFLMNWSSHGMFCIFFPYSCQNFVKLMMSTKRYGLSGTFFGYAFVCAAAVVFIVMLVPETKGRTLEEIQASMN